MNPSTKKRAEKAATYNQRLFGGGGIRSFLHNSRFEWFRKSTAERIAGPFNMIELGCFDGRLLDFCPVLPSRYEGFDANWEGGLSEAQRKFADHPAWHFHKAIDATALSGLEDGSLQVGAAMETLEHIPQQALDAYLAELARVLEGWLLVTVPNEKGPIFLSKWLVKKVIMRSAQEYTLGEIMNATLGRMEKVERNEHKGFDYVALVDQISHYFEIVSIEAIPFSFLPTWASFTVGIVARTRKPE